MLELQDRIEKERKEILGKISSSIRSQGWKATLTEESSVDYFGNSAKEIVIELSGQSIQKIRMLTFDYGTTRITYRFQCDILLDKETSADIKGIVEAQTRTIKKNKTLGLFGGEVGDIKWVGNDLADQLNVDSDLSRQLVKLSEYAGDIKLRVYVKSPSQVEILGPDFTEFLSLVDGVDPRNIEDKTKMFDYEIYDRIARQVRAALDTL